MAFQTYYEAVQGYAEHIAALRQRAGDKQRDAYTVALGQMLARDIIERETYDSLMALPRIER